MPTQKLQIYKCNVCGNLVQILLPGAGELTCCGQTMELQTIQQDTTELGEKHAPVVEYQEDKHIVRIERHPMIAEHFIQFIEVYKKDKSEVCLKYLNPNEAAVMNINCMPDDIDAIEFCNIHGLWGENKND